MMESLGDDDDDDDDDDPSPFSEKDFFLDARLAVSCKQAKQERQLDCLVPEEDDEKSLLFDVYASKLYMAMGNDMNANCKEPKKRLA